MTATNPILLLHFDLNKTVIVNDESCGITTEHMVNSILSECAWGKISDEKNEYGHHWNLISSHPSATAPIYDPNDANSNKVVTFGEYFESYDYAHLYTSAERRHFKTTFTAADSVGSALRPHFTELMSKLASLNSNVSHSCGRRNHMLPSFFYMVKALVLRKIDFRIVFRTFGPDLPSVAAEFNRFCSGDHPLCTTLPDEVPSVDNVSTETDKGSSTFTTVPRLDGSDPAKSPDRRLQLPFHCGAVRRFKDSSAGVHFSYVSSDNVSLSMT